MSKNLYRLFPLLLLIFIDSFSYFVIIPVLLEIYFNHPGSILPTTTSEFTRNFLTGFTVALSTLTALITAPLIGNASDIYGRKKALLLCMLSTTLGFLIPIFGILKKSVVLILIGRLLGGLGSTSQPIAQAAVADLCEGKEKAFFLSLIALAMTIALILGPLAGAYLSDAHLVHWFNPTTPYLFSTLISAANLFLILFGFKETVSSESMREKMLGFMDFRFSTIKNYGIGFLLILFFCLEFSWSLYYQSISLFFSEVFQRSPQAVGNYTAYLGILMCLGLVVYPLLIRWMQIETCLKVSLLFILFGFAGTCFVHSASLHTVFASLITFFTGIAYVNTLTLISNKAPKNHQGWVMGFASMVLFIAWMITGVSSGALVSVQPFLPFYLGAAGIVVAIYIAFTPNDPPHL